MLRSEHVMARIFRGNLIPHRLPPEDGRAVEVAETLCELYAVHVGRERSSLEEEIVRAEEELGPRLDPRRGFRIVRALAKLLEERAEWVSPTTADPYTIRTRIFELASSLPELPAAEPGLLDTASRDDILSQVARETGLENPASLMYADRQSAQLLGEFYKPAPQELIGRYNVAQTQGVLYSARDLVVDLDGRADAGLVFHYVKLLGLIYRLQTTETGYRLYLDGPLSIFGGTRKYGLRLAKFLPGLLLTEGWELSADVIWKGRETRLEMDSETCGLLSHYAGPKEAGEEEEVREAFQRAWERAKETGGWRLETGSYILPLPELKTALVPDFMLEHTETGERVYLEILGFWSERHLIERVSLLREAAKRGYRVLVAASEKLGTSPDSLSEAAQGPAVVFKGRLNPNAVLEKLDAVQDSSRATAQ